MGFSAYHGGIESVQSDWIVVNFDASLSRAETELTKNGVSGTKVDQTKFIFKIGNTVVFPVYAVNIPSSSQSPLGKLIVTHF